MKVPGKHLVSLILLVKSVSAFNPHVFFSNPDVDEASDIHQQPPTTVTAFTARLILANKLGVSRYHAIEDVDEKEYAILSGYLGHGLSFKHSSRSNPTAVLFIEGADNLHDAIPNDVSQHSSKVTINEAISYDANQKLLSDLAFQRDSLHDAKKPKWEAQIFQSEAEELLGLGRGSGSEAREWAKINGEARTVIAHSVILGNRNRAQTAENAEYEEAKSHVQSLVRKFFEKASKHNWDVIVAIMPSSPNSHGLSKRSTYPWGIYDLPLVARQEEAIPNEASVGNKRPITAQEGNVSPMQSNFTRGILRECYSSSDDCSKTTRNCSGHGSCSLKYSYKVEDSTVRCFACACQPETRNNSDGSKKITYWAGPACQKVDISTSFWLLASITLGLVVVVAWAIGLLYNMGQQELPSVIGAGVAGPRTR